MRLRLLLVSLTLTAALAGAGLTMLARPAAGRAPDASNVSHSSAAPDDTDLGRYQAVPLPADSPGDDREWLVIDTRTGEVAHWREQGGAYVGHTGIGAGRIQAMQTRVPKARPANPR